MATSTTNLHLTKPETGDSYNVQTLDDNYDILDAAVYANSLQPYMWVQKNTQFGNPWDGTNDYTNRAPLWGTNTWTNNVGLTSADIDFNASNPDGFIIKRKGLWKASFRLSGTTTSNGERIQTGVSVNSFTGGTADSPPNNWENSANGTSVDTADLGLGTVPFGCVLDVLIYKGSNNDVTYKPGFYAKRTGGSTTSIGVCTGVIGFTYLGKFA